MYQYPLVRHCSQEVLEARAPARAQRAEEERSCARKIFQAALSRASSSKAAVSLGKGGELLGIAAASSQRAAVLP